MNRSIPLAARERISATDVMISIGQRELDIATPSKAWAYRGAAFLGAEGIVLDALVNVSVDAILAARARSSLEPLRNVLVDFSFDDTLNADLQARITQANWVKPTGFRIVKEVTPQNLEKVLKESKASTLLFTSASYNLNFNADELSISMGARLLPNTPELQALLPEKFDPKASQIASANELYRNVFTFTTAVPGATNNRDANIALWSANNGAPMRDALKLGSAKLTEMLVADIIAEPGEPLDPKTTTLKPYKGEIYGGYIMAKDDVGTHVLQESGYEFYVTDVSLAPLVNPPEKAKNGTR
jgi:hypothetical protein